MEDERNASPTDVFGLEDGADEFNLNTLGGTEWTNPAGTLHRNPGITVHDPTLARQFGLINELPVDQLPEPLYAPAAVFLSSKENLNSQTIVRAPSRT